MSPLSAPEDWLDRYGDILYRHAMFRLRDAMLAEEMVQETLLAALNARDSFSGNSSEKTWMIGILKHKIVDHIRKAVREQPLHDDASFEALENESFSGRGHWKIDLAQWHDPDAALEKQQFWETLEMCVSQLPPRFATLFVLREIDGLDSETVCKEMALSSTNNLWTMLSRLRLRLRQCLEQHWFNRTTES